MMTCKYINGWNGLSEYLGGIPRATLVLWESEGKIKKYKIGRRVFFKPEEIDEALNNSNDGTT